METLGTRINVAILSHKYDGQGLAFALGEEPYSSKVSVGLDHLIHQTSIPDHQLIGTLQGVDVVIVSENYGGLENALQTVARIRQLKPDINIVGITNIASNNEPDSAYKHQGLGFFRAGAKGFLSIIDNNSLDSLVEAISVVKEGGLYLTNTPGLLESQYDRIIEELSTQASEPFTEREREVLRLFIQGYGNPEIAQKLGRATNTLTDYMNAIYRKLSIPGQTSHKDRILFGMAMRIANTISLVDGLIYSLQRYAIGEAHSKRDNQIFEYIPDQRVVRTDGREVKLTPQQGLLLEYFTANKDRIISRQELAENAWETKISQITAYNRVASLQNKLQREESGPQYILSVRGHGYKFTTNSKNLYPPEVKYDAEKGIATVQGIKRRLAGKPKELMDVLYDKRNHYVTPEEIIGNAWPSENNTSLYKAFQRLKSKLTVSYDRPLPVHKSSQGYMLRTF